MSEHEITWDWDVCDMPECGAPASHRMYLGDELRRRYCEEHMHQVANQQAWYWHDLAAAAAGVTSSEDSESRSVK